LYFSPVFAIAQFNKQLVRNTAAKIQILDKQINSFDGIFYVISQFRSTGQTNLIDKTLGVKGISKKFSFPNVVENLTSVFVSGEVLEDVNFFRQEAFIANPDYWLVAQRMLVQVLFRWGFRIRQWRLQLFTSRPYDWLRL
jgi:hypothetical protein